ncbi:MAG: S46 family peptidase [Rikenellaceae bacterium]
MKKLLIVAICAIFMLPSAVKADEGMWLLSFIKEKNLKDMKKAGFKLSAEDIYSVNKHALKDAIVIFGGGCTGEIISPESLLLTNHHCGYGSIQQHSSVEHDYLKDGFWAESFETEIPTPGLAVTFIRRIEEVTDRVLEGITAETTDEERAEIIAKNSAAISEEVNDREANISSRVVAMFGGNQYILFVQEKFGDVRLVGTPPSAIGKYGGDTDNWMWPRHTGDFSMFRIYSTPEGKSTAEYSADNVPYQSPKHLTISTQGVKEGDFAMIMGFPGSTERYMTTWEIDQVLEQDNPIRVYMRGEKQQIWWADMLADRAVRIQYASKYAQSSNYWKNSIGMSRGLKRLDVRSQKQAEQDAFMKWVNASEERQAKYGEALTYIEEAVAERRPAARSLQILSETLSGAEGYNLARQFSGFFNDEVKEKYGEEYVSILTSNADDFFKNYNPATDKKATYRLFEIMADSLPAEELPSFLNFSFGKNYDTYFDNSPFTSKERFAAAVKDLEAGDMSTFANDPVLLQAAEFTPFIREVYGASMEADAKFEKGHRLYLAGLLEMNEGKKHLYPDANFTIRLTYGNVLPYRAADAVDYDYITTLSGVIEKHDESNPDFVLPQRLVDLYEAKDYGRWADKKTGEIVTCFLSDNDITGGNSGSPVLNGKGELIGLAFDGNWEAMSGDIAFEPSLQRTISADIRYVLFIVDKYAGAQRLINEMTIK